MSVVFVLVLQHKDINPSQIVEVLKVKTAPRSVALKPLMSFVFLIALIWFAVSKRLSSIRFVTGIVPYLILL